MLTFRNPFSQLFNCNFSQFILIFNDNKNRKKINTQNNYYWKPHSLVKSYIFKCPFLIRNSIAINCKSGNINGNDITHLWLALEDKTKMVTSCNDRYFGKKLKYSWYLLTFFGCKVSCNVGSNEYLVNGKVI